MNTEFGMGLGEMGLGELGLGEMGLGELGLGEMGGHRSKRCFVVVLPMQIVVFVSITLSFSTGRITCH